MVSAVRLAKVELFQYSTGTAAVLVLLAEFLLGRFFGEIGYGLAFLLGVALVLMPWQALLYYRFMESRMSAADMPRFRGQRFTRMLLPCQGNG